MFRFYKYGSQHYDENQPGSGEWKPTNPCRLFMDVQGTSKQPVHIECFVIFNFWLTLLKQSLQNELVHDL